MRRTASGLATACAVLALSAPSLAAAATYHYSGNPFTLFSCGPNSDNTATMLCSTPSPANSFTTFAATDAVTATLTLTSPLAANLPIQDVRGLPGFQLTMSDGRHTVTNAVAVGMFAEVGTDASGKIVQWRLVINTGGVENGGIATVNKATSVFDSGTLACCDPTVQGNLADNFSAPGLWDTGTPSASEALSNLIDAVANPLLGLPTGQVALMTNLLRNVEVQVSAGRTRLAIVELRAFMAAVQLSKRTGRISGQSATTLINAASSIIQML